MHKMLLLFSCSSYPTLCNPMECSMPGFPVLHSLSEFAQTQVHWVHDTIQPSHPLLPLLLLPSVFPSNIAFQMSQLCSRWPKYWNFSFNISPSNKSSGLIYFTIDWFHLLAIQGILQSLLQHHTLKASVLWHSALFMVWLSHPYMTTRKNISLTIWTFVDKVMSRCMNYSLNAKSGSLGLSQLFFWGASIF